MNDWGLPGLQARYEFVPAGEQVELRLDLRFDPAGSRLTQSNRKIWLELRDRIAGRPDDEAPPAVALVTSLSPAPLSATSDGEGLRAQFVDFLSQIHALPDESDVPVAAALAFTLPKAGIEDLPGDIFELAVRLEIWPIPIAVALPQGNEAQDSIAFAAAFEDVWAGFDGAGGRLALAKEGPDGDGLWCVRISDEQGIALAPPTPGRTHFAVPPLSTVPLSGQVEGESGGMAFQSIDLDQWWDAFAAEIQPMEIAGSGRIGDRFERLRGALAGRLASRVLPVAEGLDARRLADARALYETVAAAEPDRRPVVASAEVEVGRGLRLPDEPETVLRGRASTGIGATDGASASPAGILLAKGPQGLAYALPQESGGIARPVRFEADRIERQGLPPLRFLLNAGSEADALALDLGPRSATSPLIAVPQPPSLIVSTAWAGGEAATLEGALSWSVDLEVLATGLRQDRIELAFDFGPEGEPDPIPARTVEGGLFEALGRAILFARSAPEGSEPELARIERFAELAEGVAEALKGWSAPTQEVRPLPGKWRYAVDFRDLPALIVEREGPDCPWPALEGFVAGKPDGGSLRYAPESEREAAQSLRLSLSGPRLLADRLVRVQGRTVRNARLADSVEPAFIYHGAAAFALGAAPRPEWRSPEPEPKAASLEASLASLLGRIDENSGAPYRLGLAAKLVRRLRAEGDEPVETRVPLALLPPVPIGGGGDSTLAEVAKGFAAALASARAGLDPEGEDFEIALDVTLSGEESGDEPLARLRVRIPILEDSDWWTGEEPRPE